ncbi:MAG: hypothetical protein ACK4M3_01215 [Pyrobaculum sp.]
MYISPLDGECYYIGIKVAEKTCHLFKSARGEMYVKTVDSCYKPPMY